MGNLAIIPARGGSKRISQKNIKSFLGRPIIAYSIECALNSNLFDEVMVSTDDAKIAKIAKKYGAKVPFLRSDKNSNDFATTADVIDEVLSSYKEIGTTFEKACCIYATGPLIDVLKVKESFEILENGNYDTVFTVVEYANPIQRAIKLNEGKMSLFFEEHKDARSQDLEKAYYDAGQFYSFFTKMFQEKKQLWTDNTGLIVLDGMDAQDIDTMEDWKMAELKYQIKNKG
ncbi:MAG: pseudaminic acid cytidylyltransferase [Flavobacteriales bacterium]|nr:MAG: pseudaminic acid cytidylyltransferase [Flavobacteriales bacterium]